MEKTCSRCGLSKDTSAFHKNRRKKDGLEPCCKGCNNARMRASYAANPAAKIAKTRQYHLDHPEWSKRVLREWHQANAARRYDEYKEQGKNPEVAARRREATRRSESRRRAQMAGTQADIITEDQYAQLLTEHNGACWICGIELTGAILHWDHVRPLAAQGTHTLDNIRPACSECNTRKNSLWPITDDLLAEIRSAVWVSRRAREVSS